MSPRTSTKPPRTGSAAVRPPDELEQAIRRAERRRRAFTIVVLAPVVAALVITSVYTFTPFIGGGPGDGDVQPQQERFAALERAVKEDPDDLQALVALGNGYFDAGRFDDAAGVYRRALASDPGNPDVRVDLGTCLLNLGKPGEAIAAYGQVRKSHPRHVNAAVNLGVAFRASGEQEKAASEWRRALELNEDPAMERRIENLLGKLPQAAKSPAKP